jgi:hypothetical protein
MPHSEHVQRLEDAIAGFVSCIATVPDKLFLQRFTEWAPRDVVAHLIGWNLYTLDGLSRHSAGQGTLLPER